MLIAAAEVTDKFARKVAVASLAVSVVSAIAAVVIIFFYRSQAKSAQAALAPEVTAKMEDTHVYVMVETRHQVRSVTVRAVTANSAYAGVVNVDHEVTAADEKKASRLKARFDGHPMGVPYKMTPVYKRSTDARGMELEVVVRGAGFGKYPQKVVARPSGSWAF